ncbi:MAG: polysaccharide deacetylase family protein [bacterium]
MRKRILYATAIIVIVAITLVGYRILYHRVFDPKIPVLLLHHVDIPPQGARLRGIYIAPHSLDRLLGYLNWRGYRTVSLDDLVLHIEGKRRLPPKSMVITFDDGYKDNHTSALPILQKYGFSATVFLVAGDIGGWASWESEEYDSDLPLLSAGEIEEMERNGIEFGSHSLTHPRLNRVTPEELRKEICASKALIEGLLDQPVRFFSYPYGNHNDEVKRLLRDCGYRGAVSTIPGMNDFARGDPLNIKRVEIKNLKYMTLGDILKVAAFYLKVLL